MVRSKHIRLVTRGLFVLACVALVISTFVWRQASDGASVSVWSQGIQNLLRQQPYRVVSIPLKPSQVHIALHDDTQSSNDSMIAPTPIGMTVSWATRMPTKSSIVQFGIDASDLSSVAQADRACEQYNYCQYESPWFHNVIIDGSRLTPDTTYFYRCGDPEGGWSEVYTFTTVVAVGSMEPLTFAVIGDLGQTQYSEQTLRHVINQPDLTAILHAGDLSYADGVQPRWDRWGELVEPLASTCPWMVSAGNHEEERPCEHGGDRFIAYQTRFRMPYTTTSVHRNLYYAFRVGMVHFIILTPYIATDRTSPQFKWLEKELAIVNRAVTPWVVVIMHGPWYNSNIAHQGHEPHHAMKRDMEDLLFQYKVDLVFSGHVHAYERTYPVYKEVIRSDGVVYIVLGDGGNREGLAPTYIHPKPKWSAFRQANYGFGLFRVMNRTHAQIEMHEDQEVGESKVQDLAWLTTTNFRTITSSVSYNMYF